jgi:hypothetical protein
VPVRPRLVPTFAATALAVAAGAVAVPSLAAQPTPTAVTTEVPELAATAEATFDAFDANQAVAVDKGYFYAIDNSTITKHDRRSGEPVLQFAGDTTTFQHFDSGTVVNGKLYTAHSNYPGWPMESSVEVFDTRTMEHIGTHSFGIYRGSLTWLDHHDGAWWAAFANYDKVQKGMDEPYGETYNTQVVKMDDDFQVTQSWTIPHEILDRFELMSNSGGSWGPDGRLYLTGHDLAETYVMEIPEAGAELEWIATVSLPGIEGQGIAWDRSDKRHPTLWGISRDNRQVTSFSVPLDEVTEPAGTGWEVLGPGEFRD